MTSPKGVSELFKGECIKVEHAKTNLVNLCKVSSKPVIGARGLVRGFDREMSGSVRGGCTVDPAVSAKLSIVTRCQCFSTASLLEKSHGPRSLYLPRELLSQLRR
jgi:hypothetical protein